MYTADPYRAGPPPLSKADDDALNTLSVLFYVYAFITGLAAVLFGAFAILPLLFMSLAPSPSRPGEPPPELIGGIFLVIFGAVALLIFTKSILMVFAGRALKRRTSYVLCMVASCAACVNIPLGTALGIFALTTLQKPAVKARFGAV